MQIVRTGITRDVILVGRWAIKVPTVRYGIRSLARGVLANLSEKEWSEYEGASVAPVLWSLRSLVNVYPRCEPAPDDFSDYDSLGMPFGDRKPDNIGLLGGKPVWLDYDGSWNGCPHTVWNDLGDDDEE